MKDKIERRTYPVTEIRVDEDARTLSGYAAVFEKLSVELWGFREKIRKGAFAKSIKNDTVKALWNHSSSEPLGTTKNETLNLEERDKGLWFKLELDDTTWGENAYKAIKRGDVDAMSFGFRTLKDEWDKEDEKNPIRTLVEVKLLEVSPVSFPAYPQTAVQARAWVDVVGFDPERLSGIILRSEYGLELSEEDAGYITAAIDALREYLPTPTVDDEPDGSGSESARVQLARRRRRLEILRKRVV